MWTADITYVPTEEGWLYVAAIKDLFAGEIVGRAFGERMTTDLVVRALEQAVATRRPAAGLIHHSDRGSQYCSSEYRGLLASYQMRLSMSRKGTAMTTPPSRASGAGWRSNSCITVATKRAAKRSPRSANTSTSSTTASADKRGLATSHRRRSRNSSGGSNKEPHELHTWRPFLTTYLNVETQDHAGKSL